MAYNDDSVLAKLSAVNESHESIASSAQWIIFHRRYADRTVHLWMQKLKNSSSSKRLSLIYLANEVSQQSKARNKHEFITAFSSTIAEAVSTAYKGAPAEVQSKLKRVIDVWRDRRVFDDAVQADIDRRVFDLDKSRGTATITGFSSLNSNQIPKDLAPLVPLHHAVSSRSLPVKTAFSSADQDYKKLKDPSVPTPSAPVYAARLNGLLKLLGTAESVVSDSLKARQELVSVMDKILEAQRLSLAEEEALLADVQSRKKEISTTRDEVERNIMNGLTKPEHETDPAGLTASNGNSEPDRPEMEALTPPPIDMNVDESKPINPGASSPTTNGSSHIGTSGIDILSNMASQYQSLPTGENGSNKRRRLEDDEQSPLAVKEHVANTETKDSISTTTEGISSA
ncbi:UPF0400 protein [Ceratocystis fimbriata CBS 114723]|uniref:UPF0400 protein n=1 Tax=Ceratocystis fimbriata CBS 114723 TaxID=1035309 RepID=A0A2C5WZG7_9PEZI|nr:UPF0400 protein [Ceratocystis fimbriata CBS 114723]